MSFTSTSALQCDLIPQPAPIATSGYRFASSHRLVARQDSGRLILRTRRLWDPGHVRTLSSGYQLDGLATLGTGDHLTSARGRLANGHDRSNSRGAYLRAFARLAILESVS